MSSKILRVEVDRKDGDAVTIETADGVTIEVTLRGLWRSVGGEGNKGSSIVGVDHG